MEPVGMCDTAIDMLRNTRNVFQGQTLLDKLNARREFYTVEVKQFETVLSYTNRVQQLASILSAMEVEVYGKELAMAILYALPSDYKNVIPTFYT